MKIPLILICLLLVFSLQAQSSAEDDIQKVIEQFFEAFHSRDTIQMRKVLWKQVHMQRIGNDRNGNPVLRDESVDDFLNSIASLPDTLKIEERLHSYTIQNDGAMANAWTPYTLYVQDEIHHCGVNSFQLFHDGSAWKIFYIVDTRQPTACSE